MALSLAGDVVPEGTVVVRLPRVCGKDTWDWKQSDVVGTATSKASFGLRCFAERNNAQGRLPVRRTRIADRQRESVAQEGSAYLWLRVVESILVGLFIGEERLAIILAEEREGIMGWDKPNEGSEMKRGTVGR